MLILIQAVKKFDVENKKEFEGHIAILNYLHLLDCSGDIQTCKHAITV